MRSSLRLALLASHFCSLAHEPVRATSILLDKISLNHDCYLFRFKFSQNSFRIGIGQHLQIIEIIKTYDSSQGEQIVRKYTPINLVDKQDILEILIKIYRPNVTVKFPNGGKLTSYMENLKVGDKVHMEGPFGKFGYEPQGNVILDGTKKQFKRLFFIAGGVGITPCFQIIRQIAAMPNENIELVLLFANKTEQDIILRQQLEVLQPRLKLYHILDSPSQKWNGLIGFINQQILKSISSLNDPDTLYAYCGPPPMNKLLKSLFKNKYPESSTFRF